MSGKIDLCYSSSNNTAYPVDLNNQQAVANFRHDNPHIIGSFIPAGTPFIMRSDTSSAKINDWRKERPDLACAFNHMQALPQQAKRNIALMDETYGSDNLQAIADLYHHELKPLIRNESIGAVGAAATAIDSRLSNFAKAANKLLQALEKVRAGALAKLPKHQMMILEQQAKLLGQEFNHKFQAELAKYIDRGKSHKQRTIYSDINRGINKAKSSRSGKSIQFTSTVAFNNLRAFEKGANILGKKLIVLDGVTRAGHVHTDYLAGANWQKRAAVETAGFGFGTAAGLATGTLTVKAGTALGIAFLATPAGWVVLIGSALITGYVAAKVGDSVGKAFANTAYDVGSWLSGL